MPHNVVIHYGPYSSCGIVDHRLERLQGIQQILKADGHNVEMEKIVDRNVVELFVHGQMIFTCTIQKLQYGGDGYLDPVCGEALESVRKAY